MAELASSQASTQAERGRAATKPWHLTRSDWRDILWRIKDKISQDAIGIIAAGIAFYAMLAIFPALAALVSIYGLIADPTQIQQQFASVSGALPPSASEMLMSQLKSLASGGGGALTIGLIVSILIALWSASKAMGALIISLNIVYDEDESRGFIKPYIVSLGLTLAAILFAIVTLFLIVAVPAAIGNLGLPGYLQIIILIVKWLVLAGTIVFGLSAIYRYAPSRKSAQWQWVTWGAIVGSILWLAGSALFSFYVGNFGSYNKAYGSFAAIIILLLWFNLSAYAVLIGAEVNAQMEYQTDQDTTTGERRARGKRGAVVADRVGESP